MIKYTIKGLFLNNAGEAVSDPIESEITDLESEDLVDRHPPKIKKTIQNCRYVYKNDPTVRGIILNNITTTIKNFRIESEDEAAKEYIQAKSDEWDLKSIFTQTLLKVMRDGPCFIEKAIINGSIRIRFLAYDGEDYKFKVIRNPQSDEIIGFKQKYKKYEDQENWENTEYDKLNTNFEWDEASYTPDRIIYPVLFEEAGKAEGLIASILDYVDKKWTFERFMVAAAHKAGTMIGITVGSDKKSSQGVRKSFITKLSEVFRNPIEKDVAVIPDGVSVDQIGNTTLPDLPSYVGYVRKELFIALQTPESLFSSESSNRATAEVQADDKTGYGVFIAFLRFFLKKYFENELIDVELKLKKMDSAIGKVTIEFNEEETPEPLTNEDEAGQIAREEDIEETPGATGETPIKSPDEALAEV